MVFVTTYLGLTPYCLSSNHGYFLEKNFFSQSHKFSFCHLFLPISLSFGSSPPLQTVNPVRSGNTMLVYSYINLFSESASETDRGLSRPTGRVCLLNDCPLASLAGDSSPPLAELTIMIKMGTFPGYFQPLRPHPQLWQIWGELATVSLHRERFLRSQLVSE